MRAHGRAGENYEQCLNPYYTGSYSMRNMNENKEESVLRLNPYYTGSYSMSLIIIITSFSTENNRKHKRTTLKKEKSSLFKSLQR